MISVTLFQALEDSTRHPKTLKHSPRHVLILFKALLNSFKRIPGLTESFLLFELVQNYINISKRVETSQKVP